jgi:hypothetical protein
MTFFTFGGNIGGFGAMGFSAFVSAPNILPSCSNDASAI